jgi:hypothetical protein
VVLPADHRRVPHLQLGPINGMVADGWGSTTNSDPARQKAWDGSDTQQ